MVFIVSRWFFSVGILSPFAIFFWSLSQIELSDKFGQDRIGYGVSRLGCPQTPFGRHNDAGGENFFGDYTRVPSLD